MRRRPPSKMIGIKLTASERVILESLADDSGLTMSGYIRMLILQADRERKTVQLPKTKKRVAEYAI